MRCGESCLVLSVIGSYKNRYPGTIILANGAGLLVCLRFQFDPGGWQLNNDEVSEDIPVESTTQAQVVELAK